MSAKKLTDAEVAAMKQRAAQGLRWGDRKVIAIDFGISIQSVTNILAGRRRASAGQPQAAT